MADFALNHTEKQYIKLKQTFLFAAQGNSPFTIKILTMLKARRDFNKLPSWDKESIPLSNYEKIKLFHKDHLT